MRFLTIMAMLTLLALAQAYLPGGFGHFATLAICYLWLVADTKLLAELEDCHYCGKFDWVPKVTVGLVVLVFVATSMIWGATWQGTTGFAIAIAPNFILFFTLIARWAFRQILL
jgi:hypothetical protein